MKVEKLTVSAEITRDIDTSECDQLIQLYRSGEAIYGLVDQFSFMPFIVTNMKKTDNSITFYLLMVARK